MSYARWGDGSDVYVYASSTGGVVCCGCAIDETPVQVAYTDFFGQRYEVGDLPPFGATIAFYDADSLIAHLQEHVAAGHQVPADLLEPGTYEPEDFEDQ